MSVAGFTSTGSKHPQALYGAVRDGVPLRMVSASGCVITASDDRRYLDFIMALGAVALGYGHDDVNRAVIDAVHRGGIGPLAPTDEEALASDLQQVMPWLDEVRFLKTGAEAVAAAVRIARVATGRDHVLGCGYHGWLDWCSDANGVPAATRTLFNTIPFNDPTRAVELIRARASTLACVVVEPVIEVAPSVEWLTAVRDAAHHVGAVLIFDEIKTAFRIALGGAAERWGVHPDLTVLGKAMANGYPLAAVGGSSRLMARVTDTWISSTMATEFVSIAAARVTIRVMREQRVPAHLHQHGALLLAGLHRLAAAHPSLIAGVGGIEEMSYLRYTTELISERATAACASRGLLFKRSAYNFVSLAHDAPAITRALELLAEALDEVEA